MLAPFVPHCVCVIKTHGVAWRAQALDSGSGRPPPWLAPIRFSNTRDRRDRPARFVLRFCLGVGAPPAPWRSQKGEGSCYSLAFYLSIYLSCMFCVCVPGLHHPLKPIHTQTEEYKETGEMIMMTTERGTHRERKAHLVKWGRSLPSLSHPLVPNKSRSQLRSTSFRGQRCLLVGAPPYDCPALVLQLPPSSLVFVCVPV